MTDKRCPMCDSANVAIESEEEIFDYGTGDAPTRLTALVNVHGCADCDFHWTEADAEDARRRAVDDYLLKGER